MWKTTHGLCVFVQKKNIWKTVGASYQTREWVPVCQLIPIEVCHFPNLSQKKKPISVGFPHRPPVGVRFTQSRTEGGCQTEFHIGGKGPW